jgi:hypothetical protein
VHEVILLAARSKITTIAQALRCVSNIKQGKACSQADMKATILLLDMALKTSRRGLRATKKALSRSDGMVTRLLAKIGL